jgi:hypothetical protein
MISYRRYGMRETLILCVVGLILLVFLAVKIIQSVGLEKIRGYVYKLFLEAEKNFQHGQNTAKFEYVINLAKTAIPAPFNLFITENLLRTVVQSWFDLVKDLLDDGKLNGTSIEEE